MFTTERKESPKKHYMAVDTFSVYCKCRMPEDGSDGTVFTMW